MSAAALHVFRLTRTVAVISGGPGVLAHGVDTLSIMDNYFETNNVPSGDHPDGPALQLRVARCVERYSADSCGLASNITVLTDIVLNGEGCGVGDKACGAISGDRPYLSDTEYGIGGGACYSVRIEGNHHGMDTPKYDHVNASNSTAAVAWGAILAIAVEGLQIHANSCTGERCDHSEGGFPPPLLVSGVRADQFWVTGVSISGNTGWESTRERETAGSDPPAPGAQWEDPWPGHGWVSLMETAGPSYSPHWKTDWTSSRRMHWHTVEADGVELTNFLPGVGCLLLAPVPFTGLPLPTISRLSGSYNGAAALRWSNALQNVTARVLGSIDLKTNPTLRSASVFFAVELWLDDRNTSSAQLWIDRGDGNWSSSSPECCGAAGPPKPTDTAAPAGWEVFSTQAVLAPSGTARFALHVDAPLSAGAMVRKVVVSKIGAGWNRVDGTERPSAPTT